MFKKENVQYYIATAVGVTVGLCVGKFLSPNTSIVIQNQIYPNTSAIKNAPVHGSVGKMLKLDDDVPINKYRSRSKSVPRYSEKNFEDSTLLMASLTKPSLSDLNININNQKTSEKEVKLNKTLPTYESNRIVSEKKNLSQNTETYFSNNVIEKSYNNMVYVYENTIPNADLTLKSDLPNVKKIENIPKITFVENSSDSCNESISLHINSNIATCNTSVDVEQANLISIPNDYEFPEIDQYDEFNEYNLISSTKRDISIHF